jgi:hypothetical protein
MADGRHDASDTQRFCAMEFSFGGSDVAGRGEEVNRGMLR